MRCSVCSHAKRAAIEEACAKGTALADVAARYELSERAIERHIGAHVAKQKPSPKRAATVGSPRLRAPTPPPAPPPAPEEEEQAPATSRSPVRVTARSKLDALLERVDELLDELDDEDVGVDQRIAAIRASVAPLKLLGQFTGELGVSEATVATSPHFKRMLGVILEALRPKEFAPAREAVLAALEREQRGGHAAEAA